MSAARHIASSLLIITLATYVTGQGLQTQAPPEDFINGRPGIECTSDSMEINVSFSEPFNGKIYPKGLSKTENCSLPGDGSTAMRFSLALFACATTAEELEDGSVNYKNVIVFQKHQMLVTGNDIAYRVHCLYSLGEKTVSQDISVDMIQTTAAITATPELPLCWLHIRLGADVNGQMVSGPVALGTPLTFVLEMTESDVYGFTVSHCIARDGIGWGETMLIDADGCATNEDIFPNFTYELEAQRVYATFRSHKFPTSMQVYYQCNVKLCFKRNCVIPECASTVGGFRRKRAAIEDLSREKRDIEEEPVIIVRDVVEVRDFDSETSPAEEFDERDSGINNQESSVSRINTSGTRLSGTPAGSQPGQADSDSICLTTVGFALGIAIFAGIFLLSVIVAAFLCARSRSQKSAPGYDMHSYDNRGYNVPRPDYK